ncbi:MAG TPA: (2Fe-2S)-binding protein [Synergistales bacterium]|nr:(2Fe-2S)-binding protein [Synergistales bacterium]
MAGIFTDKTKLDDDDVVVCRCKEVTLKEIREWIDRGYDTFDELKRLTGVGMGACQGRGCRDIVMKEIARRTGKSFDEIGTGTFRPPVKPVKLGTLTAANKEDPWEGKVVSH